MSDRIPPGAPGRATYLGRMKKAELMAEVLLLEEAPAPADPYAGLLPMRLYVSGTEWNGTLVFLECCSTGGDLAESWMIRRMNKVQCRHGQLIPAMPYRRISDSLKKNVRFTLAEARTAVGK